MFEQKAVAEVGLVRRTLSAWVADRGREYIPTILLPEEASDDRSIFPSCNCATDIRQAMCRHLYAVLLAYDAEVLGVRRERDPDPRSVEEVLVHSLQECDRGRPPVSLVGHDSQTRAVASEASRLIKNWRLTTVMDDDRCISRIPAGDLFDIEDDGPDEDQGERRLRALEHLGHHQNAIVPTRTSLIYYLLEDYGDEDALPVTVKRRSLSTTGKWGKLVGIRRHEVGNLRLSREDQQLLASLQGARMIDSYMGYRVPEDGFSDQLEVPALLAAQLLPQLLATGRCHLAKHGSDVRDLEDLPPALRLQGSTPAQFVIRSHVDGDRFSLIAELRSGGQVVSGDADNPPKFLGCHHVAVGGNVLPLEPIADFDLARSMLQDGPLVAPLHKRDTFLRRFAQLPGAQHLEDESILATPTQPMQPRLLIEDAAEAGARIDARVEFDYGEATQRVRPMNPRAHFFVEGKLLPRDLPAEQRHLEQLERMGVWPRVGGDSVGDHDAPDASVPRNRLDDCVLELVHSGWAVFAAERPVRRASSPTLAIRSGKDWFEVEGRVEFEGVAVELPELLKLCNRKKPRKLVRLGDGSFGVLASEWLEKWGAFLSLGEVKDGKVRMPSAQAWLLDAMLREHDGALDVDKKFERARTALQEQGVVVAAPTPPGFGTELRSYQCDGLGWLQFLYKVGLGGCLADDMGLGKTVQVLALLAQLHKEHKGSRRRPALVVAPVSLLENWQREAARFCPQLKAMIFRGARRFVEHKRSFEAGFTDCDIVLTTYGTLRRDIDKLRKIEFHYAILDEAQAIKNDHAQVSKAVRLLHAEHRLVLTGTPIENHLGEIWSLFEYLNPGMLGRSRVFRELASGNSTDPQFTKRLGAALRPFLLRRTKEQVLPDLPKKNEQVLHVELGPDQRRQYNELREHYRQKLLEGTGGGSPSDGLEGNQMIVLEALLRLRQAACHPGLIAEEFADSNCAKFEVLLPMIDELAEGDHKALVFSQFTSLLALLRPHLDARGITYEYLDGSTRDRQARVDRFQNDPECKLFLISLKAGGTGLNLTAADYVFLLDPWWNPAVEGQAIDRTHRIGQTRPVFAYRLIAKDTVEERVAELQQEKRDLVDAVLASGSGGLRGLSVQDIERLLQ